MVRKPYTPRAHQPLITQHIMRTSRCGVWAGMGLGKSVATLTALRSLWLAGDFDGPVLVIAPLRVARTTWPDEVGEWEHLKDVDCIPIKGSSTARANILARYLPVPGVKVPSRMQVFTINYENIPWLVKEVGDRSPFKVIVSDESTKLKGFRLRQGGQRAQALAKIAFQAYRFIELTGTPSPNGVADLWGQAWFLDKGAALGRTYSSFTSRWFRTGYDGFSIEPMPHAQKEIENLLKPLCLAIEAKDYFDLRDPIVNTIKVDLPPDAAAKYKEMEKQMFVELQDDFEQTHQVEAFNAAARTMKCLQIANGAAYVGEGNTQWAKVHDEKIEALREIVEEAAGMPVLVAYHFRSDLERLKAAFPKGRHLDKDPETIKDWNAGKIPVMFAHPASAGHGLSLQHGGNIIAFFSVNWNMEEHMQIIERIGPTRQMQSGYERPVFIHYILARGTVDEIILERLHTKREVQDLLMEAMKKKENMDADEGKETLKPSPSFRDVSLY